MKARSRRYSYRSVVPTAVLVGIFLPFVFIRTAFIALDAGASFCPSISCLKVRIGPLLFAGGDSSLEIMKELRRVYVEMEDKGELIDQKTVDTAPDSLDDLFAEIAAAATSSHQHLNLKSFILRTKAMLMKMDQKVQTAKHQASVYRHLASLGIPKSMHCLTLKLAEEYLINAQARSSLPSPEHSYRLANTSFIHIVLSTDNILAASVVVSSTVKSSDNPEKFVFHVVTDKKTYAAMHAWFALNSVFPAVLEVKGLHQFDLPKSVNSVIGKTVEELRRGFSSYRGFNISTDTKHSSPSSFLLLNHVKIHLPQLFPKLRRVIYLDDDVIVRRDLAPLWHTDLNGNVIGSVGVGHSKDCPCIGKRLDEYFNFSNPSLSSISSRLESDQCSWLHGMNVFDLETWRNTNITRSYQHLLKLNRESRFTLFRPGWLPPSIIAFKPRVHPIEPSWLLSGLGEHIPKRKVLESSAILHFSGPRKPWLEIGIPILRGFWRAHLNHTDQFLKSCRVVD